MRKGIMRKLLFIHNNNYCLYTVAKDGVLRDYCSFFIYN